MKVNISIDKDTSAKLANLILELNKLTKSDLESSRSNLMSKIKNLEPILKDLDNGKELLDFLYDSIEEDNDNIILIDEDPNIIDNKKLINIRTNKMTKKDILLQEVDEALAMLNKKQFSQLLSKYHNKLFSEAEGLSGEDMDEIKEKINEIADKLEDALNNDEIEITDEVTEESESESESESETKVESEDSEGSEETGETEVTEETKETEETEETEEVEESKETEDSEETEELEESEEETEEETEGKLADLDERLEELKEAIKTKDFSKVIARHYSKCFDDILKYEDEIDNIDEVKSEMDSMADELEYLDECEGEDCEVESEVKTESADCWQIVNKATGIPTGDKGCYDELSEILSDLGPEYIMKPCSSKAMSEDGEPASEELVGGEEVVENETISPDDTIQAVAESAAEQAVSDYMEGDLILGNENEEAATLTLTEEELTPTSVEVDKINFIDDKDEVIDTNLTEEGYTEDEVDDYDTGLILGDYEDDSEEVGTKQFSKSRDFEVELNPFKSTPSVEQLLGL